MMLIECSSFSKVFCFVLMEAAWQLLHDKKGNIFCSFVFGLLGQSVTDGNLL